MTRRFWTEQELMDEFHLFILSLWKLCLINIKIGFRSSNQSWLKKLFGAVLKYYCSCILGVRLTEGLERNRLHWNREERNMVIKNIWEIEWIYMYLVWEKEWLEVHLCSFFSFWCLIWIWHLNSFSCLDQYVYINYIFMFLKSGVLWYYKKFLYCRLMSLWIFILDLLSFENYKP